MAVDLVLSRRYTENGEAHVEHVTWKHCPEGPTRHRLEYRRFRRPRPIDIGPEPPDPRGRALPAHLAPGGMANRWLWIQASSPAADLDSIDPVTRHDFDSPYWDYYAIPVRAGVELACTGA